MDNKKSNIILYPFFIRFVASIISGKASFNLAKDAESVEIFVVKFP